MPADRAAPAVFFHAAGIDSVPEHDRWLSRPEAERLGGLVHVKRRSEATLGRWTAKQTVALATGVGRDPDSLARIVIKNASDGAPEVWRGGELAGVPISMTDRADWAVACVSTGRVALGCDLELVEPRSRMFVHDYFTVDEQRWVADRDDEHSLWANLTWSAKESALKVLREGLRRDTRSVEVRFHDDAVEGWRSLRVHDRDGSEFVGWWRRFGDFVLTVCADVAFEPPRPLVEPTPLASATPSHSWLREI